MGIASNKKNLIKKYFFSGGFAISTLFCLQKYPAWYSNKLVMTN